ncbi:MAG: hypothetical protein R3B13_33675 [Polyangiaceae bacterium]
MARSPTITLGDAHVEAVAVRVEGRAGTGLTGLNPSSSPKVPWVAPRSMLSEPLP